MSRQLIVTLAILACGLVPDRLSGDRPSRVRGSLKSNLLNRVDLERIERGYYEQLIVPSRRLDDLADVPGLRLRGSRTGTWSVPLDDAPLVMRVEDLRDAAQTGLLAVLLQRLEQLAAEGEHGRAAPERAEIGANERPQKPRPDRSLMISAIALGRVAVIVRNISGRIGR